jgi:hypothetical protein
MRRKRAIVCDGHHNYETYWKKILEEDFFVEDLDLASYYCLNEKMGCRESITYPRPPRLLPYRNKTIIQFRQTISVTFLRKVFGL